MECTISVAKTKALISCTVTAQLICTFVFAYAKNRFSNDMIYFVFQSNYEVGIVRQFTFSSSLQRMSVITRNIMDPHMEVYCKGAPEKIASLCNPETSMYDNQ